MKPMGQMRFEYILPGRIVFGEGLVRTIGDEARGLGVRKALIVTSRGMLEREALTHLTNSLRAGKLGYEIFSGVIPEPTIGNVDECSVFCKETKCDLIIGLGGGSAMDVAKKVAADLGLLKIMIPTTAGSGSEVTHESVLKVNGKKKAFVDDKLTPDIAIVDPDLSATMTPRLTATSGMDALAHATECYQSKRVNPVTRALAMEAYTLIRDNLRQAVAGKPEARVNISLAALVAGMAFGNSGTTLGHALSYPLSNEGIAHREAVAVLLPYVLEFNNFDRKVIDEVRNLVSELHIWVEFKSDIREMAKIAMTDSRHLDNNPRKVGFDDVVAIYRKVQEAHG